MTGEATGEKAAKGAQLLGGQWLIQGSVDGYIDMVYLSGGILVNDSSLSRI